MILVDRQTCLKADSHNTLVATSPIGGAGMRTSVAGIRASRVSCLSEVGLHAGAGCPGQVSCDCMGSRHLRPGLRASRGRGIAKAADLGCCPLWHTLAEACRGKRCAGLGGFCDSHLAHALAKSLTVREDVEQGARARAMGLCSAC